MDQKHSVKFYFYLIKTVPGLEDYFDREITFSTTALTKGEDSLTLQLEADALEVSKLLPGKNYLLETSTNGAEGSKEYFRLLQFLVQHTENGLVQLELEIKPLVV